MKKKCPNYKKKSELIAISGKIRQGKTALATSMVLDDLMHGKVVYTSWPIFWSDYDKRSHRK